MVINLCHLTKQIYQVEEEEKRLKIGAIFLLKDQVLFVNKWPLGRIFETYLGKDNVFCVVKEVSKSAYSAHSKVGAVILVLPVMMSELAQKSCLSLVSC